MSKYKGLFTFDEDNHRYVPIAQADGIIDTMDYEPDSKPAEPLIKDEKFRKVIKDWAVVNGTGRVSYNADKDWLEDTLCDVVIISFDNNKVFEKLENDKTYTIAELCGEGEDD